MKEYKGKKLYPLAHGQTMLLWGEIFSIERAKSKENSIIGLALRPKEDENHSSEEIASALEKALNFVIAHNDALRIMIIRRGFKLWQYFGDFRYRNVERVKLDGYEAYKNYLNNYHKVVKPDWLDEEKICARITLINPHCAAIVLRIHHSIFDGYSIDLFAKQMRDAYNAYISGGEPEEPKREFSFADYFDYTDKYKKSPSYKADKKFWLHEYFSQRKYSFPAGFRGHNGDCDSEKLLLDGERYSKCMEIAKETSSSSQAMMMALSALAVYSVTKKENFCFYTLVHGRQTYALKQTIGCTINNIPVFFDIKDKSEKVKDFIAKTYKNYLTCLSHGRFSINEQIPMGYYESVKHFCNFNHGWMLFSTMNFEGMAENSDFRLDVLPTQNVSFQFYDSVLEVPRSHILFDLAYQNHKFTAAQVKNAVNAFDGIITRLVENEDITIAEAVKR